jgi:pyruvate ferredoxin oxidoreductase alpha subunit
MVFVMLGSFATKAKAAVDGLREAGQKIGLLRPRLLRPFPSTLFRKLLAGKSAAAVIDQNLSMGLGGVLHTELSAALYGMDKAPPHLLSFIGGLGGRDISQEEFYEMAAQTRRAVEQNQTPPPRLLYTESELREMRKLQAIAKVEREELNRLSGKAAGEP